MLFRTVREIRDQVTVKCGDGPRTLQAIASVFEELTIIDQIVFVSFETSPENPFWGRFSRWSKSPGVYVPSQTIAEVAYASHLSEKWRRFVVCKELCHVLDATDGAFTSPTNIESLVDAFAIQSASGDIAEIMKSSPPEILAMIAALEILFPLDDRKNIISSYTEITEELVEKLSDTYGLPSEYVRIGLRPEMNSAIENLLNHR